MRTGRALSTFLAAVMTIAAATCAPALAAPDPLVPPELLAPADGASVQAGTAPTFRVRTGAGDSLLWVHVSRSSAVDACGTIDSDVLTIGLDPTGPGSDVYEATPKTYDTYSHWLNRAGTYFWQAYRIHYGGGADGCVEAPVQTLHVTGVRPIEVGPQPQLPVDGAVLPTGPQSFAVAALPTDRADYLWVHVSRSPALTEAGGVLGHDADIEPLVQSADPGVWTAAPPYYTYPSFWMNTPGTYYWQAFRISTAGDPDGYVEGPVRSLTLKAAPSAPPAAPPAPAPAAPVVPAAPQTIRGDQAFATGTANDLYLACTKLDLYLVDVLPAGASRVAVTGAADLRLKGRTIDILLDGRRVGSAVVGATGAFATTVRAPSRARRATARYQARVDAVRSQNLKLERRMLAATLRRAGDVFRLSGQVTRPFARTPATIGLQRYRSCGRTETIAVGSVRPSRSGRFTVTFPVPAASVRAVMYRAVTKVASRPGGAARSRTYTLPRAVDLR